MGKNYLMEALRLNNPKTSYFDPSAVAVSYKTGFPVLDYYLGYRVNVYDDNNKIVSSYPSIGIAGGCFVTFLLSWIIPDKP